MRLESLHPGVSLKDLIDHTGFELLIPEKVAVTEPPTPLELDLLRSLDPDSKYLRSEGHPPASSRENKDH